MSASKCSACASSSEPEKATMQRNNVPTIWTVTVLPETARRHRAQRWEIGPDGPVPTPDILVHSSLDALREDLMRRGAKICLSLGSADPEPVTETWV
jgi:hypothetical protein